MPRVDAGARIDSGTFDGGPNVRCNPVANTCPTMQGCSAELEPDGQLIARCTSAGTSSAGAGCAGPGECVPGLLCLGNASGTALCVDVCTETVRCPGAQTCDRSAPLYTFGTQAVYRCR